MLLFLLACAEDPPPIIDSPAPAAPTVRFRFAVLADPHVTTATGEHPERLAEAVAWINTEATARDLRLVLVLGDVGWSDGLAAARAALDGLEIPYVPINGDNEIQLGAEEAYAAAFADHYADLSQEFPGFIWSEAPLTNPETGTMSWFHNLRFDYLGLRWVGLDWPSRIVDPLVGERGALHDFAGGTLPFLADALSDLDDAGEHVVMFSHIPMHFSPGGFLQDDLSHITDLTAPLGDRIWANLAGHYHADGSETVADAGYDLHVTDAIWDDLITIRIVEVSSDDVDFSFTTELVTLER